MVFIIEDKKSTNMNEINISYRFPDDYYREMLQNIGLQY